MKVARGIKMDRSSLIKNSAYFGEAGESVHKIMTNQVNHKPSALSEIILGLYAYGHLLW